LIKHERGIILKKIGLCIVVVIAFAVVSFIWYSFFVKSEFEDYLSEKYPDKTFKVDFPNYSLIHYGTIVIGDHFNTSAYSDTDETEFSMSRTKGEIKDNYFERKNKNILANTVSSYITINDFDKYVRSVVIGEKKEINLDVEELQNINNSIEGIYIVYNDKIKDNKNLADISYSIINTLRSKKLSFEAIHFTSDKKNGVYELNLKGEEINKTSMELLNMINKIK